MGKMRKLKSYGEFAVNENLLVKDDFLKAELRKLADTEENSQRVSDLADELMDDPDKAMDLLKKAGYAETIEKQVGFLMKLQSALEDGDREELVKAIVDADITRQVALSKSGMLSKELESAGGQLTFGILRAIFKDAKEAKIGQESRRALWQILPRAIPMALAPFFPVLAIVGLVFGSSRALNKIMKPLFKNIDSESKYVDFLQKMVSLYMKIPEGDFDIKDRFSRAFVVRDGIIDAIKPEVIEDFYRFITKKMEAEPDGDKVPDHYIENELKTYLNDRFDIDPELGLKQ
jgi:hypothetical protein